MFSLSVERVVVTPTPLQKDQRDSKCDLWTIVGLKTLLLAHERQVHLVRESKRLDNFMAI